MKFFGGKLFALFTLMFSYILQKDDPESKIILQNRGTKHDLNTVTIDCCEKKYYSDITVRVNSTTMRALASQPNAA